eukprot:4482699-Prymnesium_polylepis.1
MAQRGDPAHVTGSCLIWLDTSTRARSRERPCEIRVLGDSGLGGRVFHAGSLRAPSSTLCRDHRPSPATVLCAMQRGAASWNTSSVTID